VSVVSLQTATRKVLPSTHVEQGTPIQAPVGSQVSKVVLELPSEQGTPAVIGLLQSPVWGAHTPTPWH
jgi:hypothetical protein